MNKSLIVNLHGGLGNQLFHYSFAKILSAKLNRKILLDASDYKQKIGNGVRNFELNCFYTKIDFIHTKSNLYNELGTLVLNLYKSSSLFPSGYTKIETSSPIIFSKIFLDSIISISLSAL